MGLKKQKRELKIFKCLRELKGYFAYRELVETFSNNEVWKHFKCRYSGTRKFGFIIRIFPQYVFSQDVEVVPNEKERLIKSFIAEHIRPFTDALNRIGLYENYLTINVKQRLGDDEMKMINDFLFFEVDFAYKWKYLKTSYIVSRFLLLIVIGAIVFNFNLITNILKNLI